MKANERRLKRWLDTHPDANERQIKRKATNVDSDLREEGAPVDPRPRWWERWFPR